MKLLHHIQLKKRKVMMFARARHPGVLCSCSNVELVHADTGVCIDPGAAEGGAARGTSGGDDTSRCFSTSLLCHDGSCLN